MREIDLTPRAREDILDIATYTLRMWGEDRMSRYIDGLNLRFLDLAEAPKLYPRRNDAGQRVRSARYGAHVIFFRITVSGIRVVRILHSKQDHMRHLHNEDAE